MNGLLSMPDGIVRYVVFREDKLDFQLYDIIGYNVYHISYRFVKKRNLLRATHIFRLLDGAF